MALTRGNYREEKPGFSDEQNREIQRGTILLQIRRYLRITWIVIGVIGFLQEVLMRHGSMISSLIYSVVVSGICYAITVYLFVYILANWVIKIFLYLKSLFSGEARL